MQRHPSWLLLLLLLLLVLLMLLLLLLLLNPCLLTKVHRSLKSLVYGVPVNPAANKQQLKTARHAAMWGSMCVLSRRVAMAALALPILLMLVRRQ